MEPISMTVKAFSAYIGIGQSKMRDIIKIEGFPALRIGNKRLIFRDEAVEWLKAYSKTQSVNDER